MYKDVSNVLGGGGNIESVTNIIANISLISKTSSPKKLYDMEKHYNLLSKKKKKLTSFLQYFLKNKKTFGVIIEPTNDRLMIFSQHARSIKVVSHTITLPTLTQGALIQCLDSMPSDQMLVRLAVIKTNWLVKPALTPDTLHAHIPKPPTGMCRMESIGLVDAVYQALFLDLCDIHTSSVLS